MDVRDVAREFAAVIVDQVWWPAELNTSYAPSRILFGDEPGVFWPRTGWLVRPRAVYERRPAPTARGGT